MMMVAAAAVGLVIVGSFDVNYWWAKNGNGNHCGNLDHGGYLIVAGHYYTAGQHCTVNHSLAIDAGSVGYCN